jgi:TonB-linked SusC/RagA family outer membrane protein
MNFYTLFNPVRKKRGRLFKILLVMKLVIFLITVACLQVSASALAQKITLNEKDAPLEKIFNEIKAQTGCNFFYEHNILNGTSKVTINVKDASLPDVLNLCLANQPLVYTIAGNNIGVKKKEIQPVNPPAPQPPKDVTGQVLDNKGDPLNGATVLIKRTKSGTLTDVKGNFTLRDVLSTDVIVVTFIGYKPLEVPVGDKTVFNLVMTEATNSLDQVMVQAYGQTSQRLSTGNITSVSAKEIDDQPIVNPISALEGKVPGLVLQQTSGYASSPIKVEIQGRTQIDPTRPSNPLYIIDGVPLTFLETGLASNNYSTGSAGINQNGFDGPAGGQSPFFSLNPSDIESISVLKDADATAIYGSRGANGVIIITTKNGKAGKTKADGSFYDGVDFVTSHYQLMNTQQYLEMREEAFKNDGITPSNSSSQDYDITSWNTKSYTDWQKLLYGNTGKSTVAQLSLSGGDPLTTFRISGAYDRETDITAISGASERASLQVNLTHKSQNQRLALSFSSTYSYAYVNMVDLPVVTLLPPDAPPGYLPNGQLNWQGWYPLNDPFPYESQPYTAATDFLNSRLNVKYELIKGLSISSNFGFSTTNQDQKKLTPIAAQNPEFDPKGQSQFGDNTNKNVIIEPQIQYNRTIGKGTLDALLGGSFQEVLQTGDLLLGNGYVNDNLLGSLANAPQTSATNDNVEYKYIALFSRLNYNWEDKYILDLTARRDGSSKFGPGKQFGNFGAVGAAWIFTQENWFKNNFSALSFGKIKGSYGITGSDDIPNYQYLALWTSQASNTYIPGTPAYIPQYLANADLQWQVDKKLSLGADLGFFKDKILVSLTYYRNITDHELVNSPLPSTTGFTSVYENLPAKIQNKGIESTVSIKLMDHKDFSWSINFDISANRNKLLSFPGLSQSPYADVYVVGQSLSIAKLLRYTGIDPLTGQYTFQDKNHDGQIDPNANDPQNDLYPVDLAVKYFGGFGTNLRYKQFSMDLFFTFRDFLAPSPIATLPGAAYSNLPTFVLNRWQKPGDNAEFAAFTTQQTNSYYDFTVSNGAYVNGSYIRLHNLAIYYDLADRIAKKIGMQKCRVFMKGENLLLLTKYPGLDPDVPSVGALPLSKTIVAGLQVSL